MQYHALALAVNGAAVDLVGTAGTAAAPPIAAHPRITCHRVADTRPAERGPAYVVRAAWRAAGQAWRALTLLVRLPRPDVILLQVPPSLPWGVLAWIVARLRGARFVIDWHNLGWTLLALRLGDGAAVRGLRRVEAWLGRRADGHLCVSHAMRERLAREPGIDAAVVYDRPPSWFADAARHDCAGWRRRISEATGVDERTIVLISPTSFTPDEDLALLCEAADDLNRRAAAVPPVLFLVSGRGGGRDAFAARVSRYAPRPGAAAAIATMWFAPEDYPYALAAADAGVCLHRSSSGLDLPMKIADMFGAGLPVLALRYDALAERVRDGREARLFDDGAGLARIIGEWWGSDVTARERLRAASAAMGQDGWIDGWTREARATLAGR